MCQTEEETVMNPNFKADLLETLEASSIQMDAIWPIDAEVDSIRY